MTNKEKAIQDYVNQKHTQEECSGFIDGYELRDSQFKPKAGEVEKLEKKFYDECTYENSDSDNRETVSDYETVWQWIQDNCLSKENEETKMKRQYKYFIENVEGEWYYVSKEFSEGTTPHNGKIFLIPSWTRDPLQAEQFNSKEDAESFAKHDTVFDRKVIYKITEHEFVFHELGKKQEKEELFIYDGINNQFDQVSSLEEARNIIKNDFTDETEGIHPDIESVFIVKKIASVRVEETSKFRVNENHEQVPICKIIIE